MADLDRTQVDRRPGTNTGHGHVWRRPDGVRARCGGPAVCSKCAADAAAIAALGTVRREPREHREAVAEVQRLREALEVIAAIATDTDDGPDRLPRSLPKQLRAVARTAFEALGEGEVQGG